MIVRAAGLLFALSLLAACRAGGSDDPPLRTDSVATRATVPANPT